MIFYKPPAGETRWGKWATITAATMKLTMVSGTSLAYNANAYQVTGGEWDPTTIQWTNKPAADVLLEGMSSVTPRMLLMDSQTGAEVPGTTVAIDPGTTSRITEIGVTAAFVCSYSTSQTITWVVQDTSVLTINSSTGQITPLKPGGITKVTANHIYNGVAYGVDFYVYLLPFLNGTYAIRSKAYNRYIQIDYDDNQNGFSTNGASLEQGTFVGDEHQMWEIIWKDNAYCSFISVLSGKAISVPSGQTANENVTLVQETYTGSDRQLWRITVTEQGQYKIKAKSAEGLSGNLVMSAGNEANGDQEGVAIKQCQYSNDSNYRDEWIVQSILNVGFSTDNYGFDNYGVDLVYPKHRASYLYATTFSDILRDNSEYAVSIKHRYNKDFSYGASKADFGVNGAISNEIDFMVYIGHGYYARNNKGNYLQYSQAINGVTNTGDIFENEQYSEEQKDMFCLYTSEARFGAPESKLRWVWLYTCNFLNSIEDVSNEDNYPDNDSNLYVSNSQLAQMMTGVHIVMGYASKATLCKAMAEVFGEYLCEGMPVYDAYFKAGHDGEASEATERHYQKILYIPQARYETVYSPSVYYEYDASDVRIAVKCIQDSY